MYVLDTDADSNRVVVGSRADLLTDRVAVRGVRLHRPGARVDRIKLRYRAQPLPARLDGAPAAGRHAALTVRLDTAGDAAAPGQLACLMDGDLVVGWGTHRAGDYLTAKSALCTSCTASAGQNTPVGGAPGRHAPPERPG